VDDSYSVRYRFNVGQCGSTVGKKVGLSVKLYGVFRTDEKF